MLKQDLIDWLVTQLVFMGASKLEIATEKASMENDTVYLVNQLSYFVELRNHHFSIAFEA